MNWADWSPVISSKVPVIWIILASLVFALHIALGFIAKFPVFQAFCLYSVLHDLLWLYKVHNPYTELWQGTIVPDSIWRIIVSMECTYGLLVCLDLGSERLRLRSRICKLLAMAAMSLIVLRVTLLGSGSSYSGLTPVQFAMIVAPRFGSLMIVVGALFFWIKYPHTMISQTRNHALVLVGYLVNQIAWIGSHPKSLARWFALDGIQLAIQIACLLAWILLFKPVRIRLSSKFKFWVKPGNSGSRFLETQHVR